MAGRDSPRGREPRYRRGGRVCTRSRVLVSGATCVIRHWQGRDRAAVARRAACLCTMGTVDGSTPCCLESRRVPVCQPLAHTAHTRSKVVPVQPPVYSHHRRLNHPTFLAPGPLLLPPRLLAPTNRYHSNRKISQWTRPARISFPLPFFSSSFFVFPPSRLLFIALLHVFPSLFSKREVVRRSVRS